MTHDELIQRGVKWLTNNQHYVYHSQIVVTEFATMAKEIPDVFGMNHYNSNVIECKVSLGDFKADLLKKHRKELMSLGNYRWYLCPPDVIPVELVPDPWGLLYCYDKSLRIIKKAIEHREPEIRAEEWYILYSIAVRAKIDGLLPTLLRTQKQRKEALK